VARCKRPENDPAVLRERALRSRPANRASASTANRASSSSANQASSSTGGLQVLDDRASRHIHRVATDRIEKRTVKPAKCKLCDRTFTSRKQLLIHRGSKGHKNKLEKTELEKKTLRCDICDIDFNSVHNFDNHRFGDKHRNARRKAENK